jgi:hypothetical protein
MFSLKNPSEHLPTTGMTPVDSLNTSPQILWRIVFAQTSFCVQVANNFGGRSLSWMTASKETEDIIIPQEYLSALHQLGTTDHLVSRYVVEKRSIPTKFVSYEKAHAFVREELGLTDEQAWHPDATVVRRKKRFFFF